MFKNWYEFRLSPSLETLIKSQCLERFYMWTFLLRCRTLLTCLVFLCIDSPVEMIKSPGIIPSEGDEITGTEHVLGIICLLIQSRVFVLPVIWLLLQKRHGLDWMREMQTLTAQQRLKSSSSEFIDMHERKMRIFSGLWSPPESPWDPLSQNPLMILLRTKDKQAFGEWWWQA